MCDIHLYLISSQYIHGLAARGVHYFHRPGPVLQDVGFFLLPVTTNKSLIVYQNVTNHNATYTGDFTLWILLNCRSLGWTELTLVNLSSPSYFYHLSWWVYYFLVIFISLYINLDLYSWIFVMLHVVDFPSFHTKEQEDLYGPHMVQSLGILSCKLKHSKAFDLGIGIH